MNESFFTNQEERISYCNFCEKEFTNVKALNAHISRFCPVTKITASSGKPYTDRILYKDQVPILRS